MGSVGLRSRGVLRADGDVRLRLHRIADIRRRIPDWDKLDRRERMLSLRRIPPICEERRKNITTNKLAQHLTDILMGQAVSIVTHYAIGDVTPTPAVTDTDLASREHTQIITLLIDGGLTLETSTFWDTGEGNGITVREGGILAGGTPGTPGSGGILLSHVAFAAQTKTSSLTMTIDHDLTWVPK